MKLTKEVFSMKQNSGRRPAVRTESGRAVACAILAAVFYALNAPMSKLLLGNVPPTMMAAFLYLGAGMGMALLLALARGSRRHARERRLTARELPYTIGMVVLDIAAPIALMAGISRTSAATASLLNNFEIVATALIALVFFKEAISPRLWLGIGLVTAASMLLSVGDMDGLSFSAGSVFVLLACILWGLENNCTRMLSGKDPVQIVAIKGIFSGLGSLAIALCLGEPWPHAVSLLLTLALGFVAYGLSICFYIAAQRTLGAAKTSAYYAIAPFVGATLSFVIFREWPTVSFMVALAVMAVGAWVVTTAESAAD